MSFLNCQGRDRDVLILRLHLCKFDITLSRFKIQGMCAFYFILLQVSHYCPNVLYTPFRWYWSSWPSWSSRGKGSAWSRWHPWTSWSEGRARLAVLCSCFLLFSLRCDILLSLFHFSGNYPCTFKIASVVPSCWMVHKGWCQVACEAQYKNSKKLLDFYSMNSAWSLILVFSGTCTASAQLQNDLMA